MRLPSRLPSRAALSGLVVLLAAGCSTSQEPAAREPGTSQEQGTSASAPEGTPAPSAASRQLPADQWPGACDLVVPDEAGTVLGGAAGAGVPGPPPELDGGEEGDRPGSCTWPVGGSDVSLRVIDVVYPVNQLWASIRIRFPGSEDLDGVATQAFVAERPDGGTSLMVCQGHTIFEIAAPAGAEVDEGALIEAGRAAAQRVEGPAGTMA